MPVSLTCRTVPAFPVRQAGRLPHHNVSRPAQRSLALRPAWLLSRPWRPVPSECFNRGRYLPQPLRLLPAGATVAGRDSHPLGKGAFHGALSQSCWQRGLGSITTCRLGCCGGSPAPMVVSDGGAGILRPPWYAPVRPIPVFRQRDLNASISEDGTRDQSVEVRLGEEFEPEFKAITGKLVDQGRFGKCPQLTAREKTRLDEFLYVQSKRSPEWRTESLERDVYRDLMGRELPSGVPPRIGTGLGASPPQRARRILQNDFADSLLRGSSEVARVLRAKRASPLPRSSWTCACRGNDRSGFCGFWCREP